MFPPKHSLKILRKSEHFPWRYGRKREWVFLRTQCTYISIPAYIHH